MSGMNPFGVVVTDVANCGGNEVARCFAVDGVGVTPTNDNINRFPQTVSALGVNGIVGTIELI